MLDKRFYRLIYLFVAVALLAGAGDLYAQETKTFQITAKKYDYIPDTIKVNQGDKVVQQATATDREHSIGIKSYNIDRELPKDEMVTIKFVADKKGEFTISCTKLCGWGHFGMKAKLIVS